MPPEQEMDVPTEPRRFQRSTHCVLCGERFPRELPFISLIWDQTKSKIVLMKPAHLVTHHENPNPLKRWYELYEQLYGMGPVAPSLHSWCWTALGDRLSVESLLGFGMAMLPCFNIDIRGNVYAASNKHFLSSALQCLAETTHVHEARYRDDDTSGDKSSLLRTLYRLRDLPEEIIFLIWKSLPLTVTRCLISFQASRELMAHLSPASQWSGVLLLHGSMTIYFRYVHGEKYICGLGNSYQQYGYTSRDYQQIQINVPVVAVSSILSIFGLRGIRYLMKDGTEGYVGPSIHNIDQMRCMTIASSHDTDPLFLKIEGDGLKIRSILRAQAEKSVFGDQFTWEACWPISLLCARQKSNLFLHPRQVDFSRNIERIFMRCIPFTEDGATLYGLSVCCCPAGGTIGFAAHFHRNLGSKRQKSYSVWRGSSKGTILHIRLKPAERITAIWVMYHKSVFDYPYLGVQSGEGRFYALAPQMPRSDLEIKLVADESEGALLGLYYDDSPWKPIRMHSFGIFSDSEPKEKQPQFESSNSDFQVTSDSHYSSIFYKLMGCMWSQFSSQAIFENVSYLETCSVGARCTGMILTYFDGHQKVLGQWYEHCPSIGAFIRKLEPIPGQGLRFFISYVEENELSYLERVELRPLKRDSVANIATDQTMVEVNYGDTIVWLFSIAADIIIPEPSPR